MPTTIRANDIGLSAVGSYNSSPRQVADQLRESLVRRIESMLA